MVSCVSTGQVKGVVAYVERLSVACRGGQGVSLASGCSDCSSVLRAGGGRHLFFTCASVFSELVLE